MTQTQKATSGQSKKKYKSPILENSRTIYNAERPNIVKRRIDSDSDDEEDLKKTLQNDHSDLLADVLGTNYKQSLLYFN